MKDYISADEYLATLPAERQKDIIEGGNRLIAQYTMQDIRRASNITQKAVAARLGISQASVSSLEERYSEAKVSTL
ncbi:MAG: helix-turn-helix domain-containing protein [Sutterella wadsworthensis]|nr:helix-turn-helix domain-containing protein [Sutterella wadsworthensis]